MQWYGKDSGAPTLFTSLTLSSSPCMSATQEAVITGLLPETTYSVTVAAYTTKGDGARSKAKLVTTTGAGVCCIKEINETTGF